MAQLDDYDTFKDYGHSGRPPNGYKKIRVHLIFAVKHDGRHKSRLVADGHLTEVPLDSVYSGVVSLHGLRLLVSSSPSSTDLILGLQISVTRTSRP
eukprot:scaffold1362_cov61-Attheya_sp.AAC.3